MAIVPSGCGRLAFEQLDLDAAVSADGGRERTDGGAATTDDASDASRLGPDVATSGDTAADSADARPADGAAPDAAPDGPAPDGPTHPLPTCEAELTWYTGFASDPAATDGNGDGANDWAWARSMPSPAERYRDGAWYPEGVEILDTRPFRPWNKRTLVFARMQNLAVDTRQTFAKGALVWLNLDNHRPDYIAIHLSLIADKEGGQTLHLSARGQPGEHITIVRDLPDRLINVALDVDPRTETAELWVDGIFQGRFTTPRIDSNPDDPFATVATFHGPSIFDDLRIVSCR